MSPFQELSDFLAQPATHEDIIAEGIMRKPSRVIVAGPPKIRKTMLVTQMALELVSGTPFLGLFDIPKHTPCMVAELEVDEESYIERVSAAKSTMYNIPDNYLWIGGPQPLLIDTPQGCSELSSEIVKKQPSVVILDPLYCLHTKDEDKSSQIKPVLMFIDKLVRDYKVSFVIVHHTKKGQTDSRGRHIDLGMDSIRGSNALYGWADSILLMDEIPGQDNILLRFWLRHGQIDPVILTPSKTTFTFTATSQGQPTTVDEQAIVSILLGSKSSRLSLQSLISNVRAKTGHSERHVRRAMSSLQKKALIATRGDGKSKRIVHLLAEPNKGWFLLE